ncbi:MAG: FAD-dependent oxidoreductase, partial [Planctomycetes bacterium]|nr:FAD-dependent oxidoreductase [Planctomycetota bacterium]
TLQLWLDEDETPDGSLTNSLFSDARTTTPLWVKQNLEAALLEAQVDFLLGCYATDILVDGRGQPAGVVIANRAGRQAIVAKFIIDCTDRAIVAEMAGAPRRAANPPNLSCRRVVLGGSDGSTAPKRSIPAGVEADGKELFYHEYDLRLPFAGTGYSAIAEAEQMARDMTYRDGQLRAAERMTIEWADPVLSEVEPSAWMGPQANKVDHFRPRGIDRLFVLGRAADVPRDAVAELLRPVNVEATGHLIGRSAAHAATRLPTPKDVSVRGPTGEPTGSGDVREILTGLRPTKQARPTIPSPEMDVPVLEDVDIVVIGGGTSGACAAIAAARQGADVLVAEYQEGLGGVGTVGLIGHPYHGQNVGFTKEVPFPDKKGTPEHKMEWFRHEIRKAGGTVWCRVLGCGVYVEDGRVRGAVVATPAGRGVVLADVVIDATGNADLAIAAGADFMYGGDAEAIALQGTGLPMRPLDSSYVNTDYLLVDEADIVDVWRALVGVRLASGSKDYDVGTFIQNRERRRVVGDHILTYLDQII